MLIGSIKGRIEELEKVWNIIERRKENMCPYGLVLVNSFYI